MRRKTRSTLEILGDVMTCLKEKSHTNVSSIGLAANLTTNHDVFDYIVEQNLAEEERTNGCGRLPNRFLRITEKGMEFVNVYSEFREKCNKLNIRIGSN